MVNINYSGLIKILIALRNSVLIILSGTKLLVHAARGFIYLVVSTCIMDDAILKI